MKLLGEEIHSEVAVLTSLSGRGDADDLAWTALEDQKIAGANVVARDSDRVGRHATLDDTDVLTNAFTDTGWPTVLVHNDLLTLSMVVVGVEWMQDTISSLLNAAAEGVIVAFVVVVTHFRFVFWSLNGGLGVDVNFFSRNGGGATIELYVVSRVDASAVFTLSDVDCFLTARGFDVDVIFRVAVWRLLVASKVIHVSKVPRRWEHFEACLTDMIRSWYSLRALGGTRYDN